MVKQMVNFKGSAKAYVAGAIAAVSFAIPVVDDGLLPSEGLGIVLAALVAFQAVYWTNNKESGTPAGGPADPAL